ncbi:glycoside hydrolase family 15 protein [Tunturibacter empetritectus]|uniref:GH15 family glucan-1,4-alpha-glucosidase n=1 Tax=Tunturiibacter lichenicola TaxID=2051959 RepID=A0A7W8J7F6_9BACT|nr:glycoside hydrolase family 15 protein [Edaphobacter lichenicola]MBB5342981.1 GH15 family glucan-1,4-alpha-glucosidase [Edaphobacter lichenicola]
MPIQELPATLSRLQLGIEDYAVIGDCRSAALVSRDGSIDWLCWPCFDSPSMFASLVGQENGGSWQICPAAPFTSSRKYVHGTNVLETTFETPTGTVRLTDFMPVAGEEFTSGHLSPQRELIRILEGVTGEVEIDVRFDPRPQYGTKKSDIQDNGKLGLRVDIPGAVIRLQSQMEFRLDTSSTTGTANIQAGDRLSFSLTFATEAPAPLAFPEESLAALTRTIDWWKMWSAKCSYPGEYREAVLRSVLALKMLHFAPSGAFVAAATTSLPEKIGGDKNYDYRYCWLRDASLAVHVLCGTGHELEAEAFVDWMLHATRLTQPKLMVVYDVYGNIVGEEKELPRLSGYRHSAPVKTGNMARSQVQMDLYGEVICASAKLYKGKGKLDRDTAKTIINFAKYVCKHWREPDAGIWEPRGDQVLHTHSLLLCWVALDELVKFVETGTIEVRPIEGFKKTRDEIRTFIETKSWNDGICSYASEPGSEKMDSSLLLMAFHNFHEASSERLQGTYNRVKNELGAGGSLLYRNRPDGRGTSPGEGAFGICGFWAVEHLAMGGGSLKQAEDTFEELLRYANDVGLFAEEIDPKSGAALGNFPQAFTHIGLISAALAIERRRKEDAEIETTTAHQRIEAKR